MEHLQGYEPQVVRQQRYASDQQAVYTQLVNAQQVQHQVVQLVAPDQQLVYEVAPDQQLVYEETPQFIEHQQIQYMEMEPQEIHYVPVQQVIVKAPPIKQYVVQQPVQYVEISQLEPSYILLDDIEPTETTFGNFLSEVAPQEPIPVITGDKLAQKDNLKPKVVKSNFQKVQKVQKVRKLPEPSYDLTKAKEIAELTAQMANLEPVDEERQGKNNEWYVMQKKIDKKYQQKLIEVSDKRIQKLREYQIDQQALFEKYDLDELLYEEHRTSVTNRIPSTKQDLSQFITPVQNEINLAEEDVMRKPQVIRKSQPKAYQQSVKQAVQQPVYAQRKQYMPVQQQDVYITPQPPQHQTYVPPQVRMSPRRNQQLGLDVSSERRMTQLHSQPKQFDTFSEQPARRTRNELDQPRHTRDKSGNFNPTNTEPRNRVSNTWGRLPGPAMSEPVDNDIDQEEEEPLCVLKVGLDQGQKVHFLRFYEGQVPEEVVQNFGLKYDLSHSAKIKLINRIHEQLQY